MTDEERIELYLKRLSMGKTSDVMNFSYADTLAYIERLKSENVYLRERLEKSVELPCKIGDNIYLPWVYGGLNGVAKPTVLSIRFRHKGFSVGTDLDTDEEEFLRKYQYGAFKDSDFGKIVFTDQESAELKLAKLIKE